MSDRYATLGDPTEEGLIVRFEPGFGLNVYIERVGCDWDRGYKTSAPKVRESFGMSIEGWERICEYAEAWRERESDRRGAGSANE